MEHFSCNSDGFLYCSPDYSGLFGSLQHFVAFALLEYGLQWSIVVSPM